MNGRVAYLDTSAFLKLVVVEPESTALQRLLGRWPERTSATLLRTEAIRALRRAGHDAYVGAARRLFSAMQLVRADEPLLDRAGELDPRSNQPA
jgi:predicted nucleic acid-binding protein